MRSMTAALIVLCLAAPAAAQQPAEPRIDVDRLPLDLKRIHKELKQVEVREERDGLNLRYRIEIYGLAPPLEIFTSEANLVHGPVPYGAPTHQEILNHITPQEFRTPIMDFSALIRWLQERNKKKEQ